MDVLFVLLAWGAAYLIGSLSFAVIVSRFAGLSDPRTYGSKNPGATNVLRSGNKVAAAATLLLDAVKGFIPVWALVQFGPAWAQAAGALSLAQGNSLWWAAGAGFAAFVGHLWPVFFSFHGGKGVATAAGVIFGIHWALGLFVLVVWVSVALVSRFSSLAAVAAAVGAPMIYMLGTRSLWSMHKGVLVMLVFMGALLIYKHRANIGRLLNSTEPKLGAEKPKANSPAR